MDTRKGQGSTEYLVILAVVLIVALVAIALLGFFPGLSTDAQKAQSDAYWQGTAYPFRIVESKATNGTLTVILQNANSQKLTLDNMSVGSSTATPSGVDFLGGEKKTTQFTVSVSGICGRCVGYCHVELVGRADRRARRARQCDVGVLLLPARKRNSAVADTGRNAACRRSHVDFGDSQRIRL